jgi:hypothetical protein
VTNEERRLTDMLHRITPEPPRPVTVEQVAYRLASEPRLGRQPRPGRVPGPRRGGLSRAWAPVAAAAAVIVIAGASAGIALLSNSHHNPSSAAGGASASSSASASSMSGSASPSQTQSSTQQTTPTTDIAGGPWGARLIDHGTFNQLSLVSADGSLYAYGPQALDRIDPATGNIVASAPYDKQFPNPPVVDGNTVWVVWSYAGGNVVLHGYNAQTLAQTASVLVPATGPVTNSASNVLSAGPDGHMYVAAGITAVVLDSNGQLIKRIYLTAGTANSVAVSPDGSTLYVGVTSGKVLVYALASDTVVSSTSLNEGDNAVVEVATSGGVWGTAGSGHSEWTWFAPNGNLNQATRVGLGAQGGFASVPSYSGGVVWVGGDGSLVCASPANGQVLASAPVGADHGVARNFSMIAVAGDHAYAGYQTDASSVSGLAQLTPPSACSTVSS